MPYGAWRRPRTYSYLVQRVHHCNIFKFAPHENWVFLQQLEILCAVTTVAKKNICTVTPVAKKLLVPRPPERKFASLRERRVVQITSMAEKPEKPEKVEKAEKPAKEKKKKWVPATTAVPTEVAPNPIVALNPPHVQRMPWSNEHLFWTAVFVSSVVVGREAGFENLTCPSFIILFMTRITARLLIIHSIRQPHLLVCRLPIFFSFVYGNYQEP